ncbi:uncharacterized protein EV422DRAFT_562613 [Fimicolochytrium jonesii]|uniref:uncharacterized protein n=1 Tax=Fimicolochytrium jonesii TaxID=1396493 RepID=UPI0022FDFA95|nr:uncharacterized protein EV422DRAFT_562613 [Fimicolochytrium jonesii]KAI8826554.1 hypothetical protein EV422DRAFT_562613 [Fimicolochytrium jonesii]
MPSTVPYTSWITSQAAPSSITLFDIQLRNPEIVLNAHPHRHAKAGAQLDGYVRLHLKTALSMVAAIKLRFVAGAVAKLDEVEFNVNLRGPQKLIDRTITLYSHSDASPTLTPRNHTFHFGLQIPSHMPPSTSTPRALIQYVVLAAIEWRSATVCGVRVPFWTWEDVVTKREVQVRRGPGRVEMGRVGGLEFLEGDGDGDGEGQTVWMPTADVKVVIPTRIPISAERVPVTIECAAEVAVERFTWSLRQESRFEFLYNLAVRGHLRPPWGASEPKQLEEIEVLHELFTYTPSGGDTEQERHTLKVPFLGDDLDRDVVAVENIETEVITIRHYAHLTLTHRPPNSSSHTTQIDIPILFYQPSTLRSSHDDTEDLYDGGEAKPTAECFLPPGAEACVGNEPGERLGDGEGVRRRRG